MEAEPESAPSLSLIGTFKRRRDGTLRGSLTDAAAIESVLIDNARSYRKAPGNRLLKPVLGNGIFLSEGERWRRNRRLMQPAFTRQHIDGYAKVMVRRTAEAVERLQAMESFSLMPEMRKLTLDIAVECLFGTDISDRDSRRLGAGIVVGGTQMQRRADRRSAALTKWLPTPTNVRILIGIRRLQRVVDKMIRERRRNPVPRSDLLSLLEAATDPEHGSLSNRDLRDEINTLLLAGHDTTAVTFTWALYLLATHPQVDAQVADEVAQVLPDGRLPDAPDLPKLPITASVVKETLRLYPPLSVIAREALEPVVVGGVPMPNGSRLRMYSMHVQRDAAVYEEPDEFRPERWRDGRDRDVPRGRYFPFSLGPRMCIGSTFATMELVLGLATLRRRHRVELLSDDTPQAIARVSLQPDRPILARVVEVARG